MRRILFLVLMGLLVQPTAAAIALTTLDGSISGDNYGAARTVQTVQTQFGDNFSELNAGYAQVSGGTLWLTLTGNIEANFNKLNIFIDTGALGGQNVLQNDANNGGNNPENDGWAQKHAGFTFDSGFDANYMLIVRRGGSQFDFDFSTVGGGLGAFEASGDIFSGALEGSNASVGASAIGVAYDDSNVAGIIGGTAAADQDAAKLVTTGLELAIPLSAIGNPAIADIKISAMVNGSNHDFLSNQVLGGLPAGQGNLGGGGVNFNNVAGNQYFSVVPEPATFALAGMAMAAIVLTRRRSS